MSGLKKISILLFSLAGGGSERFGTLLADGLLERKYEISIISPPREDNEYALSKTIKRYEILDANTRRYIKNSKLLVCHLKREKPDVLLAVGLSSSIIAALANNNRLETKIILMERNAPAHEKMNPIKRLLRDVLYPRGDAFVFQTEGARNYYKRIKNKKYAVIPNVVKDDLPLRETDGRNTFIAVGRLDEQKNYPMMLKAFSIFLKSFPEYTLRIYGKGICEADLKRLSLEMGIEENVSFCGFNSNWHYECRKDKIFLMSSCFEGMPNSLMEAMAMGFPVISTDCPAGGPASLIDQNVNGVLVMNNSVEEMVNAMIKVVSDDEFREALGQNARLVNKLYSGQVILDKWENFLLEL